MAWSSSFLCTSYLLDTQTSGHTWNVSGSDTIKLALYGNTGAYSPDTALASQAFAAGPWSGNEVTGTNWATGGVALASPVLANTTGQGGVLSFTAGNVAVASTTITGAYGCLVYDHTVNSGANYGVVAVSFGGAYSSVGGTWAVTWASANAVANVVFYIAT